MKAWDDREWQKHREEIVEAARKHQKVMQAHPAPVLYSLPVVISTGIACFIGGFVIAAILLG